MSLTKKKCLLFLFFITLIVALSACSQKTEFELYKGNALRIAVIGDPPDIKEEQVKFSEMTFDDLKSNNLESFHAVFIMKEKLHQASESQYSDIYLQSSIPIFFITAISHAPFTVKDEVFDQSWAWSPGNSYAVGVLVSDGEEVLNNWGFGLYNEELTDRNVQNVYSNIFKTIEEQGQ